VKLACAVFDMDGTIVDNMAYHVRAWLETSRRLGLSVTAGVFERDTAGMKNDEIIPWLLGRAVSREELDRIALEKEEAYRRAYRPHLAPMPGFLAFLERLERKGWRRALATAAPPGNRELVLGGLGLHFDAVIGSEHAARGKPAPDIYIAAAKALGVPAGECVAFEDALNGVRSARAAGMEVVGVTTMVPADALVEVGARWVVKDFTALPRELEEALS
jgi:HAD superfamily hydrolase (TIGR01509 family)